MAKVGFCVIGAEYNNVELLSALLKQKKHNTVGFLDESLFNDAEYKTFPLLAKLFCMRKRIAKDIVHEKLDLLGFSVINDTYQKALEIASSVKKYSDIPIIFGGAHPTSYPDQVITEKCVDMVCVGEGEYAMLELAESIDSGTIKTDIRNIYFKRNGKIIKNARRPEIEDLDSLPKIDKGLFYNKYPTVEYQAVTSRGCLYDCSYCGVTALKESSRSIGGKVFKRQSVEKTIDEIKYYTSRRKYSSVYFHDNVFTANRQWVLKFADLYKKEINLPYLIITHFSNMDEDIIKALKNSGCKRVQFGLQSYSEKLRKSLLNRTEKNEKVKQICNLCDKYKLYYTIDYIVGIPGQDEDELLNAANFFNKLKYLIKINVFWLKLYPNTILFKNMCESGFLSEEKQEKVKKGLELSFRDGGSFKDLDKKTMYAKYDAIFKILPLVPESIGNFLIRSQKIIKTISSLNILLIFIEISVALIKRDPTAIIYIKHYLWYIKRRIIKSVYKTNEV